MEVLKSILMLFGGLGVFLIGLKIMGDNLESLSGDKLKKLFNKISNNRFAGVAVGAGVTAVIQSSSATTVMIIGFVNAGVMTLVQATSIIMGANIGTTVTALIVSLQSLPITAFFAALACVGAFMEMSKKDTVNSIGAILAGIGLIFIGLDVMSGAMKYLQDLPIVNEILRSVTNPFLLVLIGLVLTALIQSSSATTSILLTLLAGSNISDPIITLKSAIFIILGINIGTCVTALLASIGANANAKRASIVHLMFNIFGSFVFFFLAQFAHIDKLFMLMFKNNIQFQVSMFHLFFNLTTTVLLLPFVKQLAQLATLIVRDKKPKQSGDPTLNADGQVKLQYVDDRLLATPSIAILMLRKEIIGMAGLAKRNLEFAMGSIINDSLTEESDAAFAETEKRIDYLNTQLTKFIVDISTEKISYVNEKELASYYHVLSDIERIGDYAENIIEYNKEMKEANAKFSDTAKLQLRDMQDTVMHLYEEVMAAFSSKDLSKEKDVWTIEDLVDKMQFALEKEHIERLRKQECTADAGSIFLSLISNVERIADHMMNVYKSMKTYLQPPTKQVANIKTSTPTDKTKKSTSAIPMSPQAPKSLSNITEFANQQAENIDFSVGKNNTYSNTSQPNTNSVAISTDISSTLTSSDSGSNSNIDNSIDADKNLVDKEKTSSKKTSKVCSKKNKGKVE